MTAPGRNRKERSVVSLFSGALGLDLGLEQAGFKVRVVVECNKRALETIKANRPDIPRIENRIEKVPSRKILEAAGLRRGQVDMVVGGPCCQSFSTAGRRESVTDPRGGLFKHFVRVVKEVRPRFFVMENVRGILSAAVRHRPLSKRGPGYPPLSREEQLGSAFQLILKQLRKTGYRVVFDLINAMDYGVPQSRWRVILIGSRDGEDIALPRPTHGPNRKKKWVTLREALSGLEKQAPVFTEIPPKWRKYLEAIPPGGCWTDLPKRRQHWALGSAYKSWGGRKGFFRRLNWSKPAPSLTTEPASKATMMCHPDAMRPLSVAEYARLQQFPDDWVFSKEPGAAYREIGNAVPVGLGAAVGKKLFRLTQSKAKKSRKLLGVVTCQSDKLAKRLASNERITRLNPSRMRRFPGLEVAKKWMAASRVNWHGAKSLLLSGAR